MRPDHTPTMHASHGTTRDHTCKANISKCEHPRTPYSTKNTCAQQIPQKRCQRACTYDMCRRAPRHQHATAHRTAPNASQRQRQPRNDRQRSRLGAPTPNAQSKAHGRHPTTPNVQAHMVCATALRCTDRPGGGVDPWLRQGKLVARAA